MPGFFLRLLISALGLWIAAALIPSMHFDSGWSVFWAAFWLGVVNALVRPVLVLLTLPITVLTLGILLLIINAAMLGLVASFLGGFSLGGFPPALFASIIVSVTSWFASYFIGPRGRIQVIHGRRD